MQFDLDRNVDAAGRDVQAAINAARGQLPANLPTNPELAQSKSRRNRHRDHLPLTSDTATTPQLYDVADSILAQKISQIPGVGQVTVGGSSRPGVRAEFNPFLLSKLGLGLDQVRTALAGQCGCAQGRAFGCEAHVHAEQQRSAIPRQRLRAADRCLSQRSARAAVGRGHGDR